MRSDRFSGTTGGAGAKRIQQAEHETTPWCNRKEENDGALLGDLRFQEMKPQPKDPVALRIAQLGYFHSLTRIRIFGKEPTAREGIELYAVVCGGQPTGPPHGEKKGEDDPKAQ
jgi:hypothetical protein